jgi:signal peptidase I
MRVGLVVVAGRSMLPTLQEGDRLLVRYDAVPSSGDLVVVRLPGSGTVAVKRAVRAEPDGWWVERDNRAEGVDSWSVGAVPDHDVLAVVVARVWPPRRSRLRGPVQH